jgi:hypothetical protein
VRLLGVLLRHVDGGAARDGRRRVAREPVVGAARPGRVASAIENAADPLACPPDPFLWPDFPQFSNGRPQVCQGGRGYNGFYGHGLLNAAAALRAR